ncbi:MAG: hypothetical protein KDB23_06735, partial [Planctomycetales bacterium]|nr:hypothetical protein [Planctomycetales bacterium]
MGKYASQKRSKLSRSRQRGLGQGLQALEDRKLMFGDAVSVIDPVMELPVLELTPVGAEAADTCIDFEDMPPAGSYVVGDTFVADNTGLQAKFTGEAFTWSSGGMTVGGAATVSHANLAADAGQEIGVNNILLNVDFGGAIPGVRLKFGEYGGNLNLEINGTLLNFEDFHSIDGAVVGGVNVSVVNGFGNDAGELTLVGTINSLKIGGQELWIDHICVADRTREERFDWGDAPDQPYPTLAVNQGAHHVIDPNVYLGKRVEAEPDGQPTAASDGDDQNAGFNVDDEDGVTFITPLIQGQMAQVEVVASTDGWLNAWVDFDRDGSWTTNAAENIFSAQPLVAGTNILSFMVPAGAETAKPTYTRWRFSTDATKLPPAQPVGIPVPNGEVEDHLVRIEPGDPDPQRRYDWGDAPDQPYPTLAANNGAHHWIDPDVFLGTTVEPEGDGQPTFASDGDDVNGVDDEDGVRFLTPLIPGQVATVEVIASTPGWLNAWIDFDRDGSWLGGNDLVFSGQPLNAGANLLSFLVPASAKPGPNDPTYSRWRFSTTDKFLRPTQPGPAVPNGEVEDHLVFIQETDPDPNGRFDWGDAPDLPYPTLAAHGGAFHLIEPGVHLGERVEPERDGQPSVASDGDDQVSGVHFDDEDGVNFLTPLIPGSTAKVEVIASVDGWLNAWIDFDRNGSWSSTPDDHIFAGELLHAGSNILTFNVPASAVPGPNEATYSRWRFSTTDRLLRPSQPASDTIPNGEVEDHLVFIQDRPEERWDFGDAPDRPYPTTLASNGARHLINPQIYLGSRIDAEADGQPSLAALGDDAAGVDDEDGVKFLTPIVPGQEVKYAVNASVDGKLDAWVDFNQNGTWEATEQIALSIPVAGGANFLAFAVPADAVPTPTRPVYSRFRFSTDGGLSPEGPARNGEVEDYRSLNGDLNDDGKVNEFDIDLLCRAI